MCFSTTEAIKYFDIKRRLVGESAPKTLTYYITIENITKCYRNRSGTAPGRNDALAVSEGSVKVHGVNTLQDGWSIIMVGGARCEDLEVGWCLCLQNCPTPSILHSNPKHNPKPATTFAQNVLMTLFGFRVTVTLLACSLQLMCSFWVHSCSTYCILGAVLVRITTWALTMSISQAGGKKDECLRGSVQCNQSYVRYVPTTLYCRKRTHTFFTLAVSGQHRTVEMSLSRRTGRHLEDREQHTENHGGKAN